MFAHDAVGCWRLTDDQIDRVQVEFHDRYHLVQDSTAELDLVQRFGFEQHEVHRDDEVRDVGGARALGDFLRQEGSSGSGTIIRFFVILSISMIRSTATLSKPR